MNDPSARLRPPGPDRRARPSEPPSRERIESIARRVEEGSYRVDPRDIAEAILSRRGPRARRD